MRRELFVLAGGPVAAATWVFVSLLMQPALIYHDPLGVYLFALFPTFILSLIYWIAYMGIVMRTGMKVSPFLVFLHAYLYHLIALPLCLFLFGKSERLGLGTSVLLSIAFNMLFFLRGGRMRVEKWIIDYRGTFVIAFLLVSIVIPGGAVCAIAYFVPEPLTPFELRGEVMSCLNDFDCAAFDCTGYNMGQIGCETNGSSYCDLSVHGCGCHVGCL